MAYSGGDRSVVGPLIDGALLQRQSPADYKVLKGGLPEGYVPFNSEPAYRERLGRELIRYRTGRTKGMSKRKVAELERLIGQHGKRLPAVKRKLSSSTSFGILNRRK